MIPDRQFEQLLPWYLAGSLERDEQDRVAAWLERSAEGRERLNAMRPLAEGLRRGGPGALGPHPATGQLADFALGRIWKSAEREAIAAHVEACPTCEMESRMARRAAAGDLLPAASGTRRFRLADLFGGLPRLMLRPAFAVIVLALVLAYPAWLGLEAVFAPGVETPVTFNVSGGTFALVEAQRGAPAEQLAEVRPAAGADHVVLEAWFPVSGEADLEYVTALLDGEGTPLDGRSGRVRPDPHGRIEAKLALAGLEPGDYTLAVTEPATGADGQPPYVVHYPFRFLPSAGAE
jgi:hypothetical protein